ncbi:MAG: hypothetical protein LBB39_01280 [Mycoplasmataceae bacterium]|nr:hypothetical protein [Mycoplasmataceae bacterium]
MELNKDYGVYLEVQNIEDKNDKYMFTELLDTLIKSNRMQLDSDGWYYPKEGTKGRYESCIAFSFMIVTRFK